MRGFLALVGVAAALALAGSGASATVTVTITKNGYVPKTTTIAAGDTVQFTNSDAVVHQVALKPTTGVTCTANPLVVPSGQAVTCTFAAAGKYGVSDPNTKGKTFQATITVTAPTAAGGVSLKATPPLVVYGGKSTLAGTLKNGKAGETIQMLAQPCGGQATTTTAASTPGGAFSAVVQPLQNTTYTASLRGSTSKPLTVQVRPRIQLAKVAAHRYSARVLAATSLAGKQASFQRYNATLGRWVRVRRVTLSASTTGVAPTVVSVARFKSAVGTGRKVRLTIAQTQVGTCYLGGISNTIRS
jgi:plastocyanin